VAFDTTLSDFVLFELPSSGAATRVCAHLGDEWLAWHEPGPIASVVRVFLDPSRGDLASLLSTVQEWLDEQDLGAIAFELDSRAYFLSRRRILQPTS
jgi:hypothetical protein